MKKTNNSSKELVNVALKYWQGKHTQYNNMLRDYLCMYNNIHKMRRNTMHYKYNTDVLHAVINLNQRTINIQDLGSQMVQNNTRLVCTPHFNISHVILNGSHSNPTSTSLITEANITK